MSNYNCSHFPSSAPDVNNFAGFDLRWLALFHLQPFRFLVVVVVSHSVGLKRIHSNRMHGWILVSWMDVGGSKQFHTDMPALKTFRVAVLRGQSSNQVTRGQRCCFCFKICEFKTLGVNYG